MPAMVALPGDCPLRFASLMKTAIPPMPALGATMLTKFAATAMSESLKTVPSMPSTRYSER